MTPSSGPDAEAKATAGRDAFAQPRFDGWIKLFPFTLLAVLGIGQLCVALGFLISAWSFAGQETTKGTIVAINPGGRIGPVVEYRIAEARHELVGVIGSTGYYRIGQDVLVRYELNDPTQARIDTWGETYALPAGFGLAGVALMLVGAIPLAFLYRRNVETRNQKT